MLSYMNQPIGSCNSHVASQASLLKKLAWYNQLKHIDSNINTMSPPEDDFAIYPSHESNYDMDLDGATTNHGVDDSNVPPSLSRYTLQTNYFLLAFPLFTTFPFCIILMVLSQEHDPKDHMRSKYPITNWLRPLAGQTYLTRYLFLMCMAQPPVGL